MVDRQKVFLSWSGPTALAVAKVWAELIGETFDAVDAFISDDIAAGARGLDEIQAALNGTSFAIVIVTRANEKAPWLNFEAGAISKQFPGNPLAKVVPCLVDFTSPAQLTTPLKQFQAKLLDKDGVEDTLRSIATEAAVSWSKKKRQFDRAWPDYEKDFAEAKTCAPAETDETVDAGDGRSEQSMIEEILELLRDDRRRAAVPRRPSTSSNDDDELERAIEIVNLHLTRFGVTPTKYKIGAVTRSNDRVLLLEVVGVDDEQREVLGERLVESSIVPFDRCLVGGRNDFKNEFMGANVRRMITLNG